MEKERIGVWGRLKMRGVKSRGLIEILHDPKSTDSVLVMSQGIRRKWLVFNFPEEMYRVKCSKDEVTSVVNDFLNKRILGD